MKFINKMIDAFSIENRKTYTVPVGSLSKEDAEKNIFMGYHKEESDLYMPIYHDEYGNPDVNKMYPNV